MCLTEIQNKKQQLALQQQQAEQQSGANKTKQANKPTVRLFLFLRLKKKDS